MLAAHSTGPADLAPADEFQWRLRAVPRCEARLASFLTTVTLEPQARAVGRQLETISAACAQMASSSGLQLVLAQVLLLGNAMNADTARGNAVGFGVEVLAQLMGVKSADQETTLMHYLVELTAARGVPAAALRSELRRVAEGAAVDLTEAAREVARLQEEVAALASELAHCRAQVRVRVGVRSRVRVRVPVSVR